MLLYLVATKTTSRSPKESIYKELGTKLIAGWDYNIKSSSFLLKKI